MDRGIIAMRYARAFMEYALENNMEDKVYEDLKIFSESFIKVPALRLAFENPVLSLHEKLSLACNAAGGTVAEVTRQFFNLVLHARREKHFQSMSLNYLDLYRKLKNISIGRVITAGPVDKEMEERLKKMVMERTHGTVEFDTKTDPSIEGGFIFEIGTYRLDASVATQLKRVKRQFIERNRRIV